MGPPSGVYAMEISIQKKASQKHAWTQGMTPRPSTHTYSTTGIIRSMFISKFPLK